MKIGIAYTTHNRREILEDSLKNLYKFLPNNAEVIVVDDASDVPYNNATFRFEENVGIARAKNKCIEILYDKGCTEFFLFDDDCFPISDDWWKPYVESDEPHLMYIFEEFSNGRHQLNDTMVVHRGSKEIAYSHARGCMLYFKRICFDVVGGMNTLYGRWGYEHPEFSCRIYNAGLTTFKYQDVVGADKLIKSLDEHIEVTSTTIGFDRIMALKRNIPIFNHYKETALFMPFRETNNVFITSYTTGTKDPQRNSYFESSKCVLYPLSKSIDTNLIVLNDCFGEEHKEENIIYTPYKCTTNPYIQRWINIYNFLKGKKYDKVFIVDGTDVKMLNSPWVKMSAGMLYVGDEKEKLSNKWLRSNHRSPIMNEFFDCIGDLPLLNAGIVGGNIEIVLEFLRKFLANMQEIESQAYFKKTEGIGSTDMALFNYTIYKDFKGRFSHGEQVNTPFKSYATESDLSWFAHK